MKTYIKIQDGQPVGFPLTEENLKYLPAELRESLAEVVHDERPKVPFTHTCEEFPRYELSSDGRAYERWIVREWTAEERASMAPSESRPTQEPYIIGTQQMRSQRNRLLAACDWTQVADVKLTDEQRAAWSAYRQALRDVPEQPDFPWQVTWPTAP